MTPLEKIRRRRGISRLEMSRRCLVPITSLRRILNGESIPDVYSARVIAREFQTTLDKLWPMVMPGDE